MKHLQHGRTLLRLRGGTKWKEWSDDGGLRLQRNVSIPPVRIFPMTTLFWTLFIQIRHTLGMTSQPKETQSEFRVDVE